MQKVVVLAMHGSPPEDFPKFQVALLVGLHMWMEHASGIMHRMIERVYTKLDTRIRTWPRTGENDPFNTASYDLAAQLSQATGSEVIVGYNEFCAPSLDEALDQAATKDVERVVVVTPMMTPGGEHAEEDIPAAIDRAQKRHPEVAFTYAWPFQVEDVARFLAARLE